METGCKCLRLSSSFPAGRKSKARFSMPSAIPGIPFLIWDYGSFSPARPSPARPGPFTTCRRAPRRLPLKMETHFVGSPAVWQKKEPLTSGGSWHGWQQSCGGGKALGAQIPAEGGACKESGPVLCVCVMCFSSFTECYHDNDSGSNLTSNITD